MKTATMTTLRAHLGKLVNERETVLVTKSGQPAALLVPYDQLSDTERLLAKPNSELRKLLDESHRSIAETGGIPHEEFWARVDAMYADAPTTKKRRK